MGGEELQRIWINGAEFVRADSVEGSAGSVRRVNKVSAGLHKQRPRSPAETALLALTSVLEALDAAGLL